MVPFPQQKTYSSLLHMVGNKMEDGCYFFFLLSCKQTHMDMLVWTNGGDFTLLYTVAMQRSGPFATTSITFARVRLSPQEAAWTFCKSRWTTSAIQRKMRIYNWTHSGGSIGFLDRVQIFNCTLTTSPLLHWWLVWDLSVQGLRKHRKHNNCQQMHGLWWLGLIFLGGKCHYVTMTLSVTIDPIISSNFSVPFPPPQFGQSWVPLLVDFISGENFNYFLSIVVRWWVWGWGRSHSSSPCGWFTFCTV